MSDTGMMDNMVAQQAAQAGDQVRFTQQMQGLRRRLSTGPDAEAELREACTDFEAVFVGKLWEQMQATVPREEGPNRHQEEMYNSMFSTEFSQHLAQAGGIGLGDMLYEQLRDRLQRTSHTQAMPGENDIMPLAEARRNFQGQRGDGIALDDGERGIPLGNEEAGIPLSQAGPGRIARPMAERLEAEATERALAAQRAEAAEQASAPEETATSQVMSAQDIVEALTGASGQAEVQEAPQAAPTPLSDVMRQVDELARRIQMEHAREEAATAQSPVGPVLADQR